VGAGDRRSAVERWPGRAITLRQGEPADADGFRMARRRPMGRVLSGVPLRADLWVGKGSTFQVTEIS
jgi:hypothetical protein